MKLLAAINIYAGGPGSGCNPDKGKCGRPSTGGKVDISLSDIEKDVSPTKYSPQTWSHAIEQGGKSIGELRYQRLGKGALITWMGRNSETTLSLGFSSVLRLFNAFAKLHPEIEFVEAYRTGGAGRRRLVRYDLKTGKKLKDVFID